MRGSQLAGAAQRLLALCRAGCIVQAGTSNQVSQWESQKVARSTYRGCAHGAGIPAAGAAGRGTCCSCSGLLARVQRPRCQVMTERDGWEAREAKARAEPALLCRPVQAITAGSATSHDWLNDAPLTTTKDAGRGFHHAMRLASHKLSRELTRRARPPARWCVPAQARCRPRPGSASARERRTGPPGRRRSTSAARACLQGGAGRGGDGTVSESG